MSRPFVVSTLLAVVGFSVGIPSLAPGQDGSRGRKLAVVVGNNEYRPNQGLENLGQAVNDAAKLSQVLRSAGFKVAEMTHDVARQPGKAVFAPNADYIRDQLDNVIETPNLGREDVVLISLHGHGVQFDFEETVVRSGKEEVKKTPKFYFCPADAAVPGVKRANDLSDRNHLISLDELYQKLEGCSATTKLLIVDACRNDPTRIENARDLGSVTRPILPSPPGGIAAFFSCKANQRALEDPELKQGVFSHFLIQGLSGKADQPLEGKPADGVVTLSELTTYVSNNTYSYVQDRFQGRQQSPDLKGDFSPNLALIRLSKEQSFAKEFANSIGMKFVLVSRDVSPTRSKDGAQQADRIPSSYYLGVYEVCQSEWELVMRSNPSWFSPAGDGKEKVADQDTSRFPAEMVNWYDAIEFCVRLNEREGLPAYYRMDDVQRKDGHVTSANVAIAGGSGYRLPAVVEWEYVATMIADRSGSQNLSAVAWHQANAEYRTHRVGSLRASGIGLYDLQGNVAEWCDDWEIDTDAQGSPSDKLPPAGPRLKVLKGGSWIDSRERCLVSHRSANRPDRSLNTYGFRVARGLPVDGSVANSSSENKP